jgi:esterase
MTQLNYQLTSKDTHKPYLVLLHGLFGSLDNLSMVRRELADKHNVLSVDLPDHGKSLRTSRFSFELYAELILQLLAQLDISKAHLLGHSLGGKVAMKIALKAPDKVSKLIVADIAPVAYSARHQNVFNALTAVELTTLSSRTDALDVLNQHLDEPGVAQFLLKGLTQVDNKWQWLFNLELLQRDYSLLSHSVDSPTPCSSPTLFIKGGKSDYILPEHRDAIMGLFPNSQAKIMASVGHWLHAENPKLFNRIVSEFLT